MNIEFLDRITFIKRADDKGLGRYLKGVWVPKGEFTLIARKAAASIPTLDWTRKQTAKAIFADPAWNDMPVGKRIALGRVLCHFVEQGLLPLRLANPKQKSGSKQYLHL